MSRPTAAPADAPTPAPAPSPDVEAALERLKHLHPKRIDLSLDRMERLLAALGHPERRLPPVVHVAGTNGKGSTVAFLRAMLEAAGHRVHAYTSPHLVRFNERIRLAGTLVADAHLAELLDRCEVANDGRPITYFEVTTGAAFLAFAEVPADVLLLEVGLGGRLDATNVIARPAVTAITRISMDHMQFLGDSLTAIAGEKAGILKPGVPAVIAPQRAPEAVAVFRAAAAERDAPLLLHGRDWDYVAEPGAPEPAGFTVRSAAGAWRLPPPGLPGAHQLENAATAVLCAGYLQQAGAGLRVPPEAVAQGLVAVDWPARLQRLRRGPLVAALPPGWELWLDGGHNDSAGEVLAAWAAGLPAGRPLHLIAGMLESKDQRAFLAPLLPHAASLHTVPVPGEPAALPAAALAEIARRAGMPAAVPAPDPAAALAALPRADGPARVLICGSLYLAGHILARHG